MSYISGWITTATLLHWGWERLFTRVGAWSFLALWIAAGVSWGAIGKGGIFPYIIGFLGFPFLAFVFLVSTVAICSFSEFLTDKVLGKTLSARVTSHQLIYFSLSLAFTAIGFLILLSASKTDVPFIP